MIPGLFQFAAVLSLLGAVLATWCLKLPVRETSLTGAWRWGVAAEFAWLLSSAIQLGATAGSPLSDQFWLWTAILTLCPLIAALGARRPGVRVWNWFIVLPMLAVLGWPGFTVMSEFPTLAPLKIQAPVCIGFALVTVMGVGNYVGTRFTFTAIAVGVAAALAIFPLSTFSNATRPSADLLRAIAGLLVGSGILFAIRQGCRPGAEESPIDRLWFDFRDTFGIVWALRIQDRLNDVAEKEAWCSRLGPQGFEWDRAAPPHRVQLTEEKMERALRWHLRRFVDPEWIDRRLTGLDL